jgi:hypothetical protein
MNINNKIDLFLTYCESRTKLLPIVLKSQKQEKFLRFFFSGMTYININLLLIISYAKNLRFFYIIHGSIF